MGFFQQDGEDHFRIEYRTPLGGIDTSAPDQFIGQNKLASGYNTTLFAGTYVPTEPVFVNWTGAPTFPLGADFIGIGELPFIGSGGTGAGIYNAAGYFYITATYVGGNATLTAWQAGDLIGSVPFSIGSVTLPCAGTLGRLTFIDINQTVYLSAPGLTGICQIKITATSPTYAFQMSLLSSQLGCSFLREMSGRLLALNVWEVVSTVVTNFPYQVAWSADSQQYGVWNVLDGSGNPTGAGFNNLPDCQDVITGAQFIGPTGYIYRQEGISEITGLNSGIQPFNFNHLWASFKGIGTVYPNTVDQYGSEGAFVSDDDIYSMGVGGLQSISGSAKDGIYNTLINSNNNVFGLICPINYQGKAEMSYILVMQPYVTTGTPIVTSFWIYNYENQEWTQLLLSTSNYAPIKDARQMQKYLTDGVTPVNAASGLLPVFVFQGSNLAPRFYFVSDPANSPSTQMQLVFPIELVAPFRDVTIDGVAVWTSAQDGSFITPTINGLQYQRIVADGTGIGGYYKSYPQPGNAANTFQNTVQLTLQIAGTAAIGHVIMYGTQRESRPF